MVFKLQVTRAFDQESQDTCTHASKSLDQRETAMPVIANRIAIASAAAFAVLAASASGALAQKKYDTGATDTEIKIGNIMPYSGPASAYGVIGKTEAAYFKKINADGGINGRKINFISYDDGYSPPKTVEQARKLVESDEVLFIFNSLGTPPNSAIHKYMNSKKVPQLFVATGATKWNDPKDFPWTMGWQPNYQSEARIYAKYLLKEKPNAKIAVLYQNDDYGKDYLKGLKDGLGAKAASMIVAEESYETTEPTIDNHIVKLKSTGADVFVEYHHAEIRGAGDQEDRRDRVEAAAFPQQRLRFGRQRHQAGRLSECAGHYFRGLPEGRYRSAVGQRSRDEAVPRLPRQGFPGGQQARRFGHRRLRRRANPGSGAEAVRRQPHPRKHHETGRKPQGFPHRSPAARHQDQHSPTNFAPISQLQLEQFKGEKWELFGDIISGDVGG